MCVTMALSRVSVHLPVVAMYLMCVAAGVLCGCLPELNVLLPIADGRFCFDNNDIDTGQQQILSAVQTDVPYFACESLPQEGLAGRHSPAIISFDDGELLAAWYAYQGAHELDGAAIYICRRPAGSTSWQTPVLHIDRHVGDCNPVLYREGDRVWMFQAVVPFGWSTVHVELQQSQDRGHTWSTPEVIPAPFGTNCKYPPVRTADGTLLLPAYDDLFLMPIMLAGDDGRPWRLQSVLTHMPTAIQPSLVRLNTGRLLAVMRSSFNTGLWATASDDNGYSWMPVLQTGFANPNSAAALTCLDNGHLVLVFNDHPVSRRRLSVTLSADNGCTWTTARIVADGQDKYSYPAVTQSPDGMVHLLYSQTTDNDRYIMHVTCNTAWIVQQ